MVSSCLLPVPILTHLLRIWLTSVAVMKPLASGYKPSISAVFMSDATNLHLLRRLFDLFNLSIRKTFDLDHLTTSHGKSLLRM
jgi:hypothetical protein